MIKEGAHTFIDGRGRVVPYLGKYAVKDAGVFGRIRDRFARAGMAEAAYRPLRIEFELTTKCNDSCPSCGMGALPGAPGRRPAGQARRGYRRSPSGARSGDR
jgi:hypothetical protein